MYSFTHLFFRLPQFTLNARIIFFMMVMFATATTASLKKTSDVVIMLKNHERALHVNAGGKVTATDISLAQFFTMESVGDIFSDTFKIALYAKEVGRYLCFRRGKLVGMKNLTRDCHFIESLEHGYFLYANAYNPLWRVGFTRGLKPVGPRHWKRPQTLKRACFLFVKINAEHFDRSRFTTTSTAAPRLAVTKTAAVVTLREGYNKLYDSKASIIDSNSSSNKMANNNGQRQRLTNSENVNATGGRKRLWTERESMSQRQRKRKHHAKLAASHSGGGINATQLKNLVRHHHDQGNGEGRRRQHQREEKERKLRLQNQRRQHQHQEDGNTGDFKPMPNATNSATPSVTATTLAATASLAPSALNIVAMLAAGRRKKGRRKKHIVNSSSNISSNSGQHQAMDLQLVAQSPLQAQSHYDRLPLLNGHKLRHQHEHNYYQKSSQTQIAPVNSTSPSTKEVKVQQQNHKYSTTNTIDANSQLYSRSSFSPSTSRNSNNLSSNLNLKPKNNVNFNLNLNNNNNDNINAIPALPKKYLSKHNFNYKTTRSSTDFKQKQKRQQQQEQRFSHFSHSRQPEQQPQINRSDLSHTSHDFYYKLPLTLLQQHQKTSDNDEDNDNDSDTDADTETDTETDDKNSNRLLVNKSNLSDNNLQQEHRVNRFKLIYLDRIRNSHNFKLDNLNYTKQQQHQHHHKQQKQHYNYDNSPISSTTATTLATTNENHLNWDENFKENSQVSNDFSSAFAMKGSSNSSAIKHNANIGRIFFTTPNNASTNKHRHRRLKRNIINNFITNSKSYNDTEVNNYNNNNNVSRNSSSSSSSNSSSSNSSVSNTKNMNVLQQHYDNNIVNIFKIRHLVYLNILKSPTTTTTNSAYRHSKLLMLFKAQYSSMQQQQQEKEQKLQNIKLINNNPNKCNYNNYNDNDNNDNDDDKDYDEQFKRIQNKYEKIIVQYRSVFN